MDLKSKGIIQLFSRPINMDGFSEEEDAYYQILFGLFYMFNVVCLMLVVNLMVTKQYIVVLFLIIVYYFVIKLTKVINNMH